MPNRRNKNDIQASTDREAAAEIVRLSQRVEQLEANFAPASGPAAGMDYEPRLRESLETCPIGVAILADDDGSRLFVNPALEAMLGSGTRDELLRADIADTWADQSLMAEVWSLLKSQKTLVNFEAERIRRDGSRWWVLMNTQPIVFEGIQASIIWHIDITGRKQAGEAAKESENRFREAVESLSDAFALFDPSDRLIFCNRMFHTLNPELSAHMRPGITFEHMVRDNIKHGRILAAKGREEEFVRDRLAQHRAPSGEAILSQRADGRWLLLREKKAPDGSTFLVNTDVTDLKLREDALRGEKERAEEANGSKSQFLATMSHELRTPLNAIMGFSDIMRTELFGALGDRRYRDYAEHIFSSGEHLLDLINDVLDLSRIEAGQYEPDLGEVNIAGVVRSSCEVMRQVAEGKGLGFDTSAIGSLPTIHADDRATRQILLNLLSNAIKFTPTGGEVVASAYLDSQGRVAITIADNGAGIAAEDMETILLPFTQVAPNTLATGGGAGLGLSIVKSLVELQGGELQIDSKLGEGTRITVRFPKSSILVGQSTAL